ncbi:yecA family protein [Acidimicrobium ferrooxidans DSM 10331]|uniref:YecA family protein n=1 Tax=Acidimicrobium ferrooxidans (strain DSM 10331 / JCM 15462 / NBRC 103882 / ICP) TaxID=525909 RepID=C7LYC8_ACIFD|nr:YecA family protein [Acidimicrobium ferrooxidans]ACU53736.1 yecA family protein [Acidimicrobium ferrooxidans DSM 10331]
MAEEEQPASPEEEELAAFFDDEDAPEDRMTFSAFDGFATGIALAPEAVPQAAWVAVALGEAADEAPPRVIELMAHYVDEMRSVLDSTDVSERFVPVFDLVGEDDGEELVSPSDWCAGFLIATEFYRDTLDALAETNDEVAELLVPIISFGTDEGLDALEESGDEDSLADELIDAIQPSVIALRGYLRSA